jgi:hypothetical protein
MIRAAAPAATKIFGFDAQLPCGKRSRAENGHNKG